MNLFTSLILLRAESWFLSGTTATVEIPSILVMCCLITSIRKARHANANRWSAPTSSLAGNVSLRRRKKNGWIYRLTDQETLSGIVCIINVSVSFEAIKMCLIKYISLGIESAIQAFSGARLETGIWGSRITRSSRKRFRKQLQNDVRLRRFTMKTMPRDLKRSGFPFNIHISYIFSWDFHEKIRQPSCGIAAWLLSKYNLVDEFRVVGSWMYSDSRCYITQRRNTFIYRIRRKWNLDGDELAFWRFRKALVGKKDLFTTWLSIRVWNTDHKKIVFCLRNFISCKQIFPRKGFRIPFA